ncbi:SWPV1-257 [Shearwaterpox virus]|uniref:SWPV1-257 n=1 Tax=Shearwaterpox virus TaxID=1974596 RepID=A0A1V0S874_CNPV|nr:SWPV1-257 [Shearwaterpox virus]
MYNNTVKKLFIYILVCNMTHMCISVCCSRYSRNNINKDEIATVRYSSCRCKFGPAAIFTMINGDEICILEDAPWLPFVLDYMNAKWLSCENQGIVISNFFLEEELLVVSH